MGLCGGKEADANGQPKADPAQAKAAADSEKQVNTEINVRIEKDKEVYDDVLKLLLLGTGDSGKSTLFKQIIQIYGKGFSADNRLPYKQICATNAIQAMQTLVIWSAKLDAALGTRLQSTAAEDSGRYLLTDVKSDQPLDKSLAAHIKLLWADAGIKQTYALRSRFQLDDACAYFFAQIDAMAADEYVPSYDDVLRCRARTTGIVETEFVIEEYRFKMLDVGGQRNERKKWIHSFEHVTAVIFVAAMNEYDQFLFEDNATNRIAESLNLFAEICNSRWFRNRSMILFLNKDDLFRDKIKTVDLKCCFDEYDGGCDYEKASAYLKRQFLSHALRFSATDAHLHHHVRVSDPVSSLPLRAERNEFPDTKRVYVHITCATDMANITFTFNVVSDIIVKERLKECGLLV